MARKVGIDRDQVLAAALEVLDDEGRPESVTLRAVAARIGIRTQSLYAHVDGAAGLRRELALRTLDELATVVTQAAVGRSGREAVEAMVRARLDYAMAQPGRFAAAIYPPGQDAELNAAIDAVSRPLSVVLDLCGIAFEDQVHWNRIAMAAVYGFALMSRDGQLTLPVDQGASADRLVDVLVEQLEIPVAA